MAFKKTIVLFLVLIAAALAIPYFVLAQNTDDPYGIDSAAENTPLIRSTQSIPEIIGTVIGIALSFVGIVFFLLILFGGLRWMTAFGNEEKVTSAKGIMEHAAIGLVIVLAAYAISRFVFGTLGVFSDQSPTDPPQELADGMGCCSNYASWKSVSTLEENCSGPTRNWEVGPCVLGCCQNAGNECRKDVAQISCYDSNFGVDWNPTACDPASCSVILLNP